MPPYDIPGVRVKKRLVHDRPYRASSLRSLGAFTYVMAIETLIDDIAHEIGVDPFEFRRRHLSDLRALGMLEQRTRALRAAPLSVGAGRGLGYARYKGISGYCAVLAKVEVGDEVRVTDVFCTADIGEVVSPDGARNQIEGGIVQSISWTLKEEVKFVGGGVAAASWLDYPILRFSEVPSVEVELIERPKEAPLGAGEISQGPTAAAVSNAVRAALGVRVRRLPISRHAIVAAASS